MKSVIWLTEATWGACVDQAARLLPAAAEVTLVHVSPVDAEELGAAQRAGLLGRHPVPAPSPSPRTIATQEAEQLLALAQSRFGRAARTQSRRGNPERELLDACADADVLVLARDGLPELGPKSLGRATRFLLDHVGCQVLLVWTEPPADAHRLPPRLRR